MAATGMLERSAKLADEARNKGVTIIHAPITFKEDASDNPNKALGILAGCANDKLFTEGTWNAEFVDQMAPQPGDVVVQGKKGLDAFPGTDLEEQLKARGIETVALAGEEGPTESSFFLFYQLLHLGLKREILEVNHGS